MSLKKVLFIIGGLFLVGILFFGLLIYLTIKTKSTDITDAKPFQEWVGKKVELKNETIIFKEKIPNYEDENYPYEFLDSLQPKWQYVSEQIRNGNKDLEEIDRFSAGATFTIKKATMYTNGVSGTSYPYAFGTLTDGNKTYQVGFRWGEQSMSRFFDDVEEQWKFPQAPWQNQPDSKYYALPEANWW